MDFADRRRGRQAVSANQWSLAAALTRNITAQQYRISALAHSSNPFASQGSSGLYTLHRRDELVLQMTEVGCLHILSYVGDAW